LKEYRWKFIRLYLKQYRMNPIEFDKRRGESKSGYVYFEFDRIIMDVADIVLEDEVTRVIQVFWLLYDCHEYEEVQEELPVYNKTTKKSGPMKYETVKKYANISMNKIMNYIYRKTDFNNSLKKAVENEIKKLS